MRKKPGNNTLSRRVEILDLLNDRGKISIMEMSRKYKVSEVTIRNDLAHLEQKGLLVRTRGGAIKPQPTSLAMSLHQRLQIRYHEKQKIGKAASEMIEDGQSLVLDSGSTAIEAVKHLHDRKNLIIITNSLPVADICVDYEDAQIIMTGGNLRAEMRSLIGPLAADFVGSFQCDVAIIGADAVSAIDGVFTPLQQDAIVSRAMVKSGRKVILAVDSSKFTRHSLVKICEIQDIDVIITDDGIAPETLNTLRQQVEVRVV